MAQRFGFSLTAVFIASWQRCLSVPKPAKQNVVKLGDHSSIWDSWPIAFSGYPRGPRVGCETGCPRHHASNFAVETRSRTRVSQVPGKPPLGLDPLDGTELWEHSSCLWVQISGVEAYSFLPDDQDDRCDFACQGQPCHLRLYSFADLSIVKLLERPCLGGGNCRGTL